eukprot:CAMPEP_0172561596 /NCGR_PEP_ID=MMETSP1067-20121228/93523_1 /TAXON_ID=265564 ORGANISM="Thalassiosira punctigera, Strain Tpunct2005C2" /NCGR_SAMPLE_ID=MMETSP1067 /ASSEMBLY_ACC=CAM_ASM_000444 /LENGTH=183 /DNA_ID=CAMNT_0013351669 /DNA_START=20 /DNA_END=568 /DNA_ORIENTATION=-
MRAFSISCTLVAAGSLGSLPLASCDSAYIYYTNAYCTDQNTIAGTFNMGYDNAQMEGLGVQENGYTGQCFYFNGGKIDIESGYEDIHNNLMAGYCCDGTNAWSSEEEDSGEPWYSRWVSAWTSWFRKDGSSSTNGDGGAATDDGGGAAADDDGGADDDGDDDDEGDDGTDEFRRALHGPRHRP